MQFKIFFLFTKVQPGKIGKAEAMEGEEDMLGQHQGGSSEICIWVMASRGRNNVTLLKCSAQLEKRKRT